MNIDLSDRVVVVTGAGRGVGRGYALALAQRGARVIVNDLGSSLDGAGSNRGPAADVVAEIATHGGVAIADHSDVSLPEGTEAIVRRALSSFGRIDAVIANAGITGLPTPFAETSRGAFERMIAVHLGGSWGLAKAAWPHFVRQQGGRIIFTTSGAIAGHPNGSAYATAKAGIIGLTRTLALEGASHGIIVNAIAPMAFTRMAHAEVGDRATAMAIALPPASVAPAALALLSEQWSTSGEIYSVGGGHVDHIFLSQGLGIAEERDWQPERMVEQAHLLTTHSETFALASSADTARHVEL